MSFRIRSDHLLIRAWTAGDRPAFRRLATDPVVMRYISDGRPWTEEEISGFFRHEQEVVERHGFCLGALELAASGEVIGLAGLQPLGTTGEVEVGWWLAPEHWHRGYATEAGRAAVEHAFGPLDLPRVTAIVHPDNRPSQRVMERLGMSCQGHYTGRELGLRLPELEVLLYALERPAGGV